MDSVLQSLVAQANCPIEVRLQRERVRSSEIPVLCSDSTRLRAISNWAPQISLEQTLAETLADARRRVTEGEAVGT
jgi:GDP-4-dehydro-6-deoxy-D-mannose reductase